MKMLITADTHLSSYKQREFDPLQQIRTALLEILNVASDYNVDYICIAGDVFNDKTIVYKNALDVLYEFLNLSEVPVILLHGNHDYGRHGSLLEVISHDNALLIYDEPYYIENVMFVPWNTNVLESIHENYRDHTNILISHFGLYEAKLNTGISRVDPIRLRDLRMFKLAILGHYHLPQSIKSDVEVVYVGTPCHMSWNEKNQDTRCIILDTEKCSYKSVELTTTIRFIEFTIDDDSNIEQIEQQAEELVAQGHIVRIKNKTRRSLNISDMLQVIDCTPSETKFSNCTSIYDIAKTFVEDIAPSNKENLMETFNEITNYVSQYK